MSRATGGKLVVKTVSLPPQYARPSRADSAFTLVEMLLVVVLLATLTGTLAASLSGRVDRHALRIAGKDLAMAVRFSVAEARLKRLPHRVAFHDHWTSYRVEKAESGAGREYTPVRSLAGQVKTLAKQVRVAGVSTDGRLLESLPEALPQYPNGNGFRGEIQLANRAGETLTIKVLPVTGQVRIVE